MTGSILAAAGTTSSGHHGGAGTVYTKAASAPLGTLVIDNSGLSDTETTQISSNVTDTVVGDLAIRAASILRIVSNQMLTVQGNWTNSGTFMADTNSTVALGGTNLATVYKGETFFNLTSTNAGKQIDFLAGSTTIVNGALSLRNTDVRSTVDGTWWYLKVMPSGTNDVKSVYAKDSNATNGQTIVDREPSHNNGHNVNWVFQMASGSVFIMR